MILPGYLKASRAASDSPRPSAFNFKALRALSLVSQPPRGAGGTLKPVPSALPPPAYPDDPDGLAYLETSEGRATAELAEHTAAELEADAYDEHMAAEAVREHGREIDRKTIGKTRADHYCEACKGDIPAGDTAERITWAGGTDGGGFRTFYRCHLCQSGDTAWRGGGAAGDPYSTFEGSEAGPLYGRTR